MSGAALRAAGATDPGLQRDNNEDRFHVDASRGLFMVVDGVGGQAAGGEAAMEHAVCPDRESRAPLAAATPPVGGGSGRGAAPARPPRPAARSRAPGRR